MLHLAKIGQQLARQRHELLKTLLERRLVQQRNVACQHLRDFGIDFIAACLQFGNTGLRVGFAAFAHLLEQAEHRQQPRFGADEAAFGQRRQPGNCLFGGRRQVELRLVRACPIELAKPALVVGGPVVEVVDGGLGKGLRAQPLAHAKQLIVQRLGQISLRHHANIGRDEHALQKARHQRRVIRTQKTPGGVALAQQVERCVIKTQWVASWS